MQPKAATAPILLWSSARGSATSMSHATKPNEVRRFGVRSGLCSPMTAPPTRPGPPVEANPPMPKAAWYAGVTRYQWLVLAIASMGWVFDAFEGQVFNITRNQLLADLLKGGGTEAAIKNYGDIFLAVFLAGGTVGGLLFGSLADRFGRRPVMAVTILMYSIFSGATFFAQTLWRVGIVRCQIGRAS